MTHICWSVLWSEHSQESVTDNPGWISVRNCNIVWQWWESWQIQKVAGVCKDKDNNLWHLEAVQSVNSWNNYVAVLLQPFIGERICIYLFLILLLSITFRLYQPQSYNPQSHALSHVKLFILMRLSCMDSGSFLVYSPRIDYYQRVPTGYSIVQGMTVFLMTLVLHHQIPFSVRMDRNPWDLSLPLQYYCTALICYF